MKFCMEEDKMNMAEDLAISRDKEEIIKRIMSMNYQSMLLDKEFYAFFDKVGAVTSPADQLHWFDLDQPNFMQSDLVNFDSVGKPQ